MKIKEVESADPFALLENLTLLLITISLSLSILLPYNVSSLTLSISNQI